MRPLSFIQIRGQDGDEVDHVLRGDEKTKNEVRDEAYGLPMNLINILENPNNWIKRNLHGKHERNGRYYYAKMHQNPMEYRNTYQYLVFRYASANCLNRVIEKLYQWELEFHNSDAQEVLKCWRLHLGSCDVFKMVIAAHHYDAKSTYQLFLKKWYLPLKTRWTNRRRSQNPNYLQKLFNLCARPYNTLFFAIRPFMGASALCLDILKNWILVYIFWSSLDSLVEKDFKISYENTLMITMITVMGLAQLSIMTLSFLSAPKIFPKIFKLCEHNAKANPGRALIIRLIMIIIRLVCALIGPIFPVVIFANYIFVREQQHKNERQLQSHGSLDDPDDDAKKVVLFRKILKFRHAASLHKHYYSYFRIVQATMESIVVLITLLLIMVILPDPQTTKQPSESGREFWNIVSEKISDFIGFDFEGIMKTLKLNTYLAFHCVLVYNVLMIITAITRQVVHIVYVQDSSCNCIQ